MKHALAPTRTRLIQAAVTLFQTQGYFATSVSDILVEAQAPKGSLYHHFPDGKAELAIAAVDAVRADVLSWLHHARARNVKTADMVRLLADGMARWLNQAEAAQGSLFSVLAMECATREPQVHDAVRLAYAAWRAALADAIDAEPADARATADLIIATLEGGLILARADKTPAPLLAAAQRLAHML